MEKQVTYCVWAGQMEEPLGAVLEERLNGHPPAFVLRDPVNQRDPLPDFDGLTTPDCMNRGVPLAEARLFYAGGLLHLVADGGQTRWAAWWEEADSDASAPPTWCTMAGELHEQREAVACEQKVLLRHSRAQRKAGEVDRGLSVAKLPHDTLTVRLYYTDGLLQWWRVLCDG